MKITSLLIIITMIVTDATVLAWDNVYTHPTISESAAKVILTEDVLNTQLVESGTEKRVKGWIREGSRLEDAGSNWDIPLNPQRVRFRNHFQGSMRVRSQPGTITKFFDILNKEKGEIT